MQDWVAMHRAAYPNAERRAKKYSERDARQPPNREETSRFTAENEGKSKGDGGH